MFMLSPVRYLFPSTMQFSCLGRKVLSLLSPPSSLFLSILHPCSILYPTSSLSLSLSVSLFPLSSFSHSLPHLLLSLSPGTHSWLSASIIRHITCVRGNASEQTWIWDREGVWEPRKGREPPLTPALILGNLRQSFSKIQQPSPGLRFFSDHLSPHLPGQAIHEPGVRSLRPSMRSVYFSGLREGSRLRLAFLLRGKSRWQEGKGGLPSSSTQNLGSLHILYPYQLLVTS